MLAKANYGHNYRLYQHMDLTNNAFGNTVIVSQLYQNSTGIYCYIICIHMGCIVVTISCFSFPTVPWGAFPYDEREHEPARSVVVYRSDHHPHHHRHLANETSQELLRGQKAGVKIRKHYKDNNPSNIYCHFVSQAWKYSVLISIFCF